jgi:hypothetical protein
VKHVTTVKSSAWASELQKMSLQRSWYLPSFKARSFFKNCVDLHRIWNFWHRVFTECTTKDSCAIFTFRFHSKLQEQYVRSGTPWSQTWPRRNNVRWIVTVQTTNCWWATDAYLVCITYLTFALFNAAWIYLNLSAMIIRQASFFLKRRKQV